MPALLPPLRGGRSSARAAPAQRDRIAEGVADPEERGALRADHGVEEPEERRLPGRILVHALRAGRNAVVLARIEGPGPARPDDEGKPLDASGIAWPARTS